MAQKPKITTKELVFSDLSSGYLSFEHDSIESSNICFSYKIRGNRIVLKELADWPELYSDKRYFLDRIEKINEELNDSIEIQFCIFQFLESNMVFGFDSLLIEVNGKEYLQTYSFEDRDYLYDQYRISARLTILRDMDSLSIRIKEPSSLLFTPIINLSTLNSNKVKINYKCFMSDNITGMTLKDLSPKFTVIEDKRYRVKVK